ncbi:MAG: ChaN family lipoprotein [Candidatus Cloacimonadales bacterium]
MIKRIFFMSSLLIFSLFCLAQNFSAADYQIYSAAGAKYTLAEMTAELAEYDVIFFGEWHDDLLLHQIEAEILPLLSSQRDLAISLEMFERDVQPVLDKFLSAEISETEFLKNSRPWGNYLADYKPLVDFAVHNELDVIAANVPRRYAAAVHKKGPEALDTLPKAEQKFVARKLQILDNKYKEKFLQTISGHMNAGNAMGSKMRLENIYAAQCLKDDTMAESIVDYLLDNPQKQLIHYNGNFHSEEFLGTANRVKLLQPELKIAVITPVVVSLESLKNFDKTKADLGTFLIFAPRYIDSDK